MNTRDQASAVSYVLWQLALVVAFIVYVVRDEPYMALIALVFGGCVGAVRTGGSMREARR